MSPLSDATLRADARRNRKTVLATAVTLLAERPQATMQEIADASGLGRTTVYRHFPRRRDLIDALFVEVVREARAAVAEVVARPQPAHDVLCALGPKFIEIGDRYRFLDAHPELRERALNTRADPGDPLTAFLADAQARGEVRPDVPVVWMLTALRGLTVAAIVELAAGRLAVEDAGRLLGTTFARAFAAAPSGK
jgi:AcrR family transcriptional regulator